MLAEPDATEIDRFNVVGGGSHLEPGGTVTATVTGTAMDMSPMLDSFASGDQSLFPPPIYYTCIDANTLEYVAVVGDEYHWLLSRAA